MPPGSACKKTNDEDWKLTQGTILFFASVISGKMIKQLRIHQPTGFEALRPGVQKRKNETNSSSQLFPQGKTFSNLEGPTWLARFFFAFPGLGRIEVTPEQWHGQVCEEEIANATQDFCHDAGVLQLPQLP